MGSGVKADNAILGHSNNYRSVIRAVPDGSFPTIAAHCLVRNRRGVGFTFSAEEASVLKGLISLRSSNPPQTLAKENSSTRFEGCTNAFGANRHQAFPTARCKAPARSG